jgi:hypothetical protein
MSDVRESTTRIVRMARRGLLIQAARNARREEGMTLVGRNGTEIAGNVAGEHHGENNSKAKFTRGRCKRLVFRALESHIRKSEIIRIVSAIGTLLIVPQVQPRN